MNPTDIAMLAQAGHEPPGHAVVIMIVLILVGVVGGILYVARNRKAERGAAKRGASDAGRDPGSRS